MSRNFYFGSDAGMAKGSAAFSAVINEDPSALGLSEAQAGAYALIDAELQSAMRAAKTPETRTAVAVARKNGAIRAMQDGARHLSAHIRAASGVTDAQLVALGLLPRTRRARRHVPQTPPRVEVVSCRGRVVEIRVCDAASPSARRKPFGATGAEVFTHVGEQPPTTARGFQYGGQTSRTTMRVIFPDEVPSGATVWFSARWISRRGERGVASTPVPFTVQGGPVAAVTADLARRAAA